MTTKRKLTLSITLAAALLMAVVSTGSALANEGTEVEGIVNGWNEVDFTIDLKVEVISDPVVDPPLTEILTVQVGQNFDFTTLVLEDTLVVTGTYDEDGTLIVTGIKILDRIRDRIQLQDGEGDAYFCDIDTDKVHPVAEKIAGTYGYEYEDILPYLCDDNISLGRIMLALQTAALSTDPVVPFDFYLTGDMDEFSWGQIWQEFDIKGKPDKGIPPGEIQKGDKDGDPEEQDAQGNKNKDGDEGECDQLFCNLYNWIQNQKGGKGK